MESIAVQIVIIDEKCDVLLNRQIQFLQQLLALKKSGLRAKVSISTDQNIQEAYAYFGDKVVYGHNQILEYIENYLAQKSQKISTQHQQMINKQPITRAMQQRVTSRRDDDFEEIPDNLGQRASQMAQERNSKYTRPSRQHQESVEQVSQQKQVISDENVNVSSISSFQMPSQKTTKKGKIDIQSMMADISKEEVSQGKPLAR